MNHDKDNIKKEELRAWNDSPMREVVDAMKLNHQLEEMVRRSFRMGYLAGRIKNELDKMGTPQLRTVSDEEN